MGAQIMMQGTGSNVGKSLLCTALARICQKRNIKTMPFKPQNMSNNAAAITGSGEIGRAQALQARAAKEKPNVDMNPILLKPESEKGAQLIIRGKKIKHVTARQWFEDRQNYLPYIMESWQALKKKSELIIVEGAGSPAEINLRKGDVANMGFAEVTQCPVILIGDIHRGGVIAAIVGTLNVLDKNDQNRIKGFIINNFHGDPSLFEEGRIWLEKKTKIPCLGVIPHFPKAQYLPAEDSLNLHPLREKQNHHATLKIAVPKLSRIANFDDLDPLAAEKNVQIHIIKQGHPIPKDIDLILIPGTKATIADLKCLKQNGWDIDIYAHLRHGGHVLGLCGGFQMLGKKIHDPKGYEGKAESVDGLNLLDIETTLIENKTVQCVNAHHCQTKTKINAYEIHIGKTQGKDLENPFAKIKKNNHVINEGAISENKRIQGTYLHGLFSHDQFRKAWLQSFRTQSTLKYETNIENIIDELAQHMEKYTNIDKILQIAGLNK